MQGAWGDLLGFNFLVRYEYKYKPKDTRSPFIYKHTQTHAHIPARINWHVLQ